jgi:hypothetical protein
MGSELELSTRPTVPSLRFLAMYELIERVASSEGFGRNAKRPPPTSLPLPRPDAGSRSARPDDIHIIDSSPCRTVEWNCSRRARPDSGRHLPRLQVGFVLSSCCAEGETDVTSARVVSIQTMAESVGITNLDDSVAVALTADVEFRLHQVIEVRTLLLSRSRYERYNTLIRIRSVFS